MILHQVMCAVVARSGHPKPTVSPFEDRSTDSFSPLLDPVISRGRIHGWARKHGVRADVLEDRADRLNVVCAVPRVAGIPETNHYHATLVVALNHATWHPTCQGTTPLMVK